MKKPEDYQAKPDKTIKEHSLELLSELERIKNLGYIDNKELYELTKKACWFHDFGKANAEFQNRVMSDKKIRMSLEREVYHNILSIFLIDPKAFDCQEDYYKVAQAVLFHHDYADPYEVLKDKKDLCKSLLKNFTCYPVKHSLQYKLNMWTEDDQVVIIKGLLHKCDYSASGGYVSEYPNDFLESGLDRLGYQWNDLQNFCIKNRNENIITVAQTGMGKTEAGLLWIGNHKGYFVLPLRTAINAIYHRIVADQKKKIVTEKLDERVALLHSSSLSYYLEMMDNSKTEMTGIDREDFDVEEYRNRGLKHSIPLNIATMDQLFDFVFKYQGYELKLTTLSYSKIVIDEIQMYDSDLLAYLVMGLKRICELGGKIAILTATLAPFVEDELNKAIPGLIKQSFFDNTLRHNIQVKAEELSVTDILNQYDANKELEQGNKILVICNTVKKAQEIFEKLSETDTVMKDELFLLHSKFTRGDRAEKEAAIKDFGKTYAVDDQTIDIQNGIWVSTSLVEASLDIDFDYLFTELQDLNSLLQRLGRCNRKGVKPTGVTNCFVYTVINENLFIINNRGFIDLDIFNISKQALENWNGPITEAEKLALINEHLTTEKLKNSNYYQAYIEKCNWIATIKPYQLKQDDIKLRNILTVEIIPSPVFDAHRKEIHELTEKINRPQTDTKEKIALKEKLYAYTLSVESYHAKNYEKAKARGEAMVYTPIQIGRFESIKVLECQYDDLLGFRKMDYQTTRKAEFF